MFKSTLIDENVVYKVTKELMYTDSDGFEILRI